MTDRSGLRLIPHEGGPARPPDEDLVACFQADPGGEAGQAAAAELLQRYRDRVYVWCRRRLGDHDAALDAAQDTLIAAYRALPGFGGRARFSSWLFAVARNRCVSALRARPPATGDDTALENLVDGAPDPEAMLLDREVQALVLELMDRVLDTEERTALWLKACEGLPVEEISRLLQLPGASGARAVLQRARRRLRAALAARLDPPSGPSGPSGPPGPAKGGRG